jgi:hypothetical protein
MMTDEPVNAPESQILTQHIPIIGRIPMGNLSCVKQKFSILPSTLRASRRDDKNDIEEWRQSDRPT